MHVWLGTLLVLSFTAFLGMHNLDEHCREIIQKRHLLLSEHCVNPELLRLHPLIREACNQEQEHASDTMLQCMTGELWAVLWKVAHAMVDNSFTSSYFFKFLVAVFVVYVVPTFFLESLRVFSNQRLQQFHQSDTVRNLFDTLQTQQAAVLRNVFGAWRSVMRRQPVIHAHQYRDTPAECHAEPFDMTIN